MVGITAFGGYVPRLRLSRQAIAEAHRWNQPAMARAARGERAICNWDEDSLTMAVEAARDCLAGPVASAVDAVMLASTTAPFADRQNAGVLRAALDLPEAVRTMDLTGSQRAGTSALMAALAAAGQTASQTLVVAADARRARAGSALELNSGDAAAAFLVGGGDTLLARLLAMHTESVDFVDHYRATDQSFDYAWEDRWIRDEGLLKIVPRAIGEALAKANLPADRVDHLVLFSPLPRTPAKVAAAVGVSADRLAPALHAEVGEAGAAHPLLMLAYVLQAAAPGRVIAVVGFGQGCDVLLFETTDVLPDGQPARGVAGWLARRTAEDTYQRYLAFTGLIERELGLRAEVDHQTALTQLYRRNDMLLGLVGGVCGHCGTRQFPRSRICVNPNCGAVDSQQRFRFADVPAHVLTWSADHLTHTPDPPAHYGMVRFDGGGRMFAAFTDVTPGTLAVGQAMRMTFRIKEIDQRRGFRRYFWKAAPEDPVDG